MKAAVCFAYKTVGYKNQGDLFPFPSTFNETHKEFAKQGVGPGEPRTGVVGGIVLMKGFVHEASASMGGLELV